MSNISESSSRVAKIWLFLVQWYVVACCRLLSSLNWSPFVVVYTYYIVKYVKIKCCFSCVSYVKFEKYKGPKIKRKMRLKLSYLHCFNPEGLRNAFEKYAT
jgi:hypothetical protein